MALDQGRAGLTHLSKTGRSLLSSFAEYLPNPTAFIDRTNKSPECNCPLANPDSPEPEPVYVNVDPMSRSPLVAEAQPSPVLSGPGRPLVRSQVRPSHPRDQSTGRPSSFVEEQARGNDLPNHGFTQNDFLTAA